MSAQNESEVSHVILIFFRKVIVADYSLIKQLTSRERRWRAPLLEWYRLEPFFTRIVNGQWFDYRLGCFTL